MPAAIALLSRGRRDNPLPVRVFGEDPQRRQRVAEQDVLGAPNWFKMRPSGAS
ncbi:MAG: hypothetical protein ACLPVF_14395 [Acidimicrobiales bacterium]